MISSKTFPAQREGELFLTEGGTETEIMYKWGFELPHFAMFPLLDNPDAVSAMRGMFRRQLGVAAKHGMAEANHRSIDFLRDVTEGDWISRIRGFRSNASKMEKIALCKLGHLEEGDPVELGRLMGDLARRYPDMDIWGECCGNGEVRPDEIAKNVCAVRRETAVNHQPA